MATTSPVAVVLEALPGVRSWQEEVYQDLHQHPELSHQERRTAQVVTERLRAIGYDVPVMHACGHDVHVACLLGAAQLLADGRTRWSGTVVTLFQPAEETGDGARSMVDDGLGEITGRVDVALAQHVLAVPAGTLGTRSGPTLSAADHSSSFAPVIQPTLDTGTQALVVAALAWLQDPS